MQKQDITNSNISSEPIQSWSDTELAWSSIEPYVRGPLPTKTQPRVLPLSKSTYPPSTRYGNQIPRNYSRSQALHRAMPEPAASENSTSILWQLTAAIALVVLVFCSYQSNQPWAVTIKGWAQFAMAWDYPTDQIVQWFQQHVGQFFTTHTR